MRIWLSSALLLSGISAACICRQLTCIFIQESDWAIKSWPRAMVARSSITISCCCFSLMAV